MKGNYIAGIAAVVLCMILAKPCTAEANQVSLVNGTAPDSRTVEQMLMSYEAYSVAGRQIRSDLYLASMGEQGEFYTEYKDRIAKMRMNGKKYTMLSHALELALLEKQQEYYTAYEELIELKTKVVEIKKRFGLSVDSEEAELRAEKKSVEKNALTAEKAEALLVSELRQETDLGNKSLYHSFIYATKTYEEHAVISRYVNQSESYLQAGYYYQTYHEQEEKLQQATEEPGAEEVRKQLGALAENYEIQQENIRKQLEKYAKQVLATYEENCLEMEAAQSNLTACEKKYNMECKKFEYGRSTKIAVLESKIAMIGAQLEYLQCMVTKTQLEYMLDNGVVAEE